VDEWLTRARDALSDETGLDAGELELDQGTATELLDLARIAAYESGDRTNAPLLCFLLGRASRNAPLGRLAARIRGL
jgi:Domain of unknown function (DUF6457)